MLAALDLPTEPPLVIGAEQSRLIVIDGPLDGRADEVSPPKVCGASLKTPVTRSNRLGIVTSPVLGSSLRV